MSIIDNQQQIEVVGGDRVHKCLTKYKDKNKQFINTVRKFIKDYSHPSLCFEKLNDTNNLYSIRMNEGWRIILQKEKLRSKNLYFWVVLFGPHNIYNKIRDFINSPSDKEKIINLDANLDIGFTNEDFDIKYQKRIYNLKNLVINLKEHRDYNYSWDIELDRCLEHTEGQRKIIHDLRGKELFIQGDSGTGKTTVAIYRALYVAGLLKTQNSKVVLLTYNEKLFKVLEYYTSYLGHELGTRIQVSTFNDFMNIIANKLEIDDINYISEFETKKLLKKAVEKSGSDISRQDAYNLLYTFKMGSNEHFDDNRMKKYKPFIKRRTCKKIHESSEAKDILTNWDKANLIQIRASEFWTIFNEYNSLLNKKKYGAAGKNRIYHDIFDKAWDIYSLLQNDIVIDPIVFIIDEVQDFRPLELEIVQLLIANMKPQLDANGHQLTLLGDLNQQITITDFKWERFENDYGISPTILDMNLRNTYEIYLADNILFKLCNDSGQRRLKKPKVHGNRPQMLVMDSEDKIIDLFKTFVERESYPDTLGIIFGSKKLRARSIESIKNEPFTINADDSKGLEFEDLIIIGLFNGYSTRYGKGKNIPKTYRDLWHVTLSRGRNNLMVIVSTEELKILKNNILFDDAHSFLNCFDISYTRVEWRKAIDRFIKTCDYDLPGMARILIDLGKAEALWKQFKKDNKTTTKIKVISEYCRYKYFDGLINNLLDYTIEKRDLNSYLDIAVVSLMMRNEERFVKYLKKYIIESSSVNNEESIIALINYVESVENYNDFLLVILQYLFDERIVDFTIFTELLVRARSSTVREIATTFILNNIIETNRIIFNHMELI